MSAVMERPATAPEWFVDQMPPGYRNRIAEIERLTKELEAMDRFGGLLWQSGAGLEAVVRDAFTALKLELTPPQEAAGFFIARLDANRRLLIFTAPATGVLQKKGPELAEVFRILHEFAHGSDRVVVVANSHPDVAPDDRDDGVTPEALNFLSRLGANFLPAPTLFALWKLAFEDGDRVRRYLDRLYEQDGGSAPPLPGGR